MARFKEKIRQDLRDIPNYTCLETIERTRRATLSPEFLPVDIVRLEVSSVAGKELFALPGRQFQDRSAAALVTHGAIASGMFASFARDLFAEDKGTLKRKGVEKVAGRAAIRYDFRLTRERSGFKLQVGNYWEIVAARGSFWFDPVSLDLLRLEVHGADIPFNLHIDDAVVRTDYSRTHIGASDALLPQRSEMTMTYISGVANRDTIGFSQCRAYQSESRISFDTPPAVPRAEVPRPMMPPPEPESESVPVVAIEPAPALPKSSLPAEQPLPPAAPMAAPPPASDVVIRSSVREVLLEVAVHDGHGRLVKDLTPDEVSIYEDGVRQQIQSFHTVAGRDVRIEDEKQTRAVAAPDRRIAFNPLRLINIVCLVLNDLNPDTRATAFDAARLFVDTELRPNTFIGVFALDGGGLRSLYPFSSSREQLLKAVQLASVNQLPSLNVGVAAALNGLSATANAPFVPGGGAVGVADGSSTRNPLGVRGEIGFSENTGLREIDALRALVRQLGALEVQKTVLLLGTGLTRPPDQLEYWDSLIKAANENNVRFYAMDVYGLGVCQGDTDPDCVAHSAVAPAIAMLPYVAALSKQQAILDNGKAGAGQPAGSNAGPPVSSAAALTAAQGGSSPSATAQMAELSHQDDYLKFMVSSANRQEAVRELAERTGGFLIANTNNTAGLLARVMEEVDTHYEISYRPNPDAANEHFRRIEVKLTRPGLKAETRGGYYGAQKEQ
ncbi:MAG TPA: VWA domain-containing protein [Bryobacteraceae bacterium]|nr:VWA domain-containing protein [Bryobacteraceae bacterium]